MVTLGSVIYMTILFYETKQIYGHETTQNKKAMMYIKGQCSYTMFFYFSKYYEDVRKKKIEIWETENSHVQKKTINGKVVYVCDNDDCCQGKKATGE